MKNFRRSKKALSPVVASIILIAVTVAVSIAVAAWMGALSLGFMQTEQLTITTCTFSGTDVVTLHVRNTGANDIVVTATAYVNGIAATGVAGTPDLNIEKNTEADIAVTMASDWVSGDSYQIKLASQKGTNFVYNAVAAP